MSKSYEEILEELISKGSHVDVIIHHDDWCKREPCTCKPVIDLMVNGELVWWTGKEREEEIKKNFSLLSALIKRAAPDATFLMVVDS